MYFYSTNDKTLKVSFRIATLDGLPNDNGLYMPEFLPEHSSLVNNLSGLTFHDIAYIIAESFVNKDIPKSELEEIIHNAITFDAPLINIENNKYILELFHGPTLAFKDFGACFMSRTMESFVKNNDKELNILVATSGDTGSAVANGFYGVEGINVIILYPSKKVSDIQEKQISTLDKNIFSLEIEGTFDDCQKLVKQAFLDNELNNSLLLSSANSINIARLIPQTFYYFHAYSQLKSNNQVVISVPSGNFGNLTAGIIAKKMGLPVVKFIAATNSNDVVPLFLETGYYNSKQSIQTISNAMDVGNPSNINRILDLYNNDIKSIKDDLDSWSYSDNETKKTISETLNDNNYLLDPHGAVGLLGLNEFLQKNSTEYDGIFLGTAHPSKFADIIEEVINDKVEIPSRLSKMISKEKKSILMKNDFKVFSDYLLTNFK